MSQLNFPDTVENIRKMEKTENYLFFSPLMIITIKLS
jgi:hypothetical protein